MSRRVRWRIAILLVPLLIVGIWLGLPAFNAARYRAKLDASRQKLKQIGLALHNYHDKHGSFPPAYTLGPDGKPWHSWRVLVLPFMNEQNLYDRYRFDEPWNGPHNKTLQDMRPDAYASKLQKSKLKSITTYLGVVSRRTMWPAHFCVHREDVTDGTSNTVMLLENVGSDVIWSEPREMREKDALALLRPASAATKSPATDRFITLFGDASTRSITPHINRDLFISLLTPKFGEYVVKEGWPVEENSTSQLPEVVEISKYPGTIVLPSPETTLTPNQSCLYCATTQLAWDELRPGVGQPVIVTDSSPTADSLNAHPFPKASLDERAYYVNSARLDDAKSGALFDDFRRRFPNAPVEALGRIPDELPGLRILAYLEKSMPFPDVMERFSKPLLFDKTNVQSFGWPSASGEGNRIPVLNGTVEVRDYAGADDFIVLLKTDSPQKDEIILARIEPDASLQATWITAVDRMQRPKASDVVRELRAVDELQIPILSFGVISPVKELIGLRVPTAKHPDRYIEDARQTIRFRLDEYGAELIADMQMVVGENGDGALHIDPLQPRRLIFDRPFLIAIKEKNATVPYFLAWIGNTDLMELTKKTDTR